MLNLLKINETLFEEEVSGLAESIKISYSAEFPFIRPTRDRGRGRFQQKKHRRKNTKIQGFAVIMSVTHHK